MIRSRINWDHLKPQPVFVYGTLRAGGGLFASFLPLITSVERGLTTSGDLYFHPDTNKIPVADLTGEGTVQGDLLMLNERGMREVVLMEYGAGYISKQVTVNGSEHGVSTAIAFHWPHYPDVGSKIDDGDFLVAQMLQQGAW